MENKTTGSWIIHHTHKLQGVTLATPDYEQIGFAGKCGIVLNALARSTESELTNERVVALAKANGIHAKLELPAILAELQRQRLIDKAAAGIAVLGLTTAQTLEHTATIFDESSPRSCEKAAIDISERASDLPIVQREAAEYVSDEYHIPNAETVAILRQCEEIGFLDAEQTSAQPVYFNGNLFRREDMAKTTAILSSLNAGEQRRVVELTDRLKASGCIRRDDALALLDAQLYSKMCAIGVIDENSIGNESGTFSFITRPAAFAKFTNSAADDAFDLAKAFVTSLTYGMTSSIYRRGRITMIDALMQKLIAGMWVRTAHTF